MSALRLYRRFYHINNEVYTLINPSSLSAQIYNATLSFLVESPIVVNESTGVYYIEISPTLYNDLYVYELRWSVVYITGAPQKTLSTYFKYSSTGSITIYRFGEINFEIQQPLTDIELKEAEEISLEVLDEKFEFDVSQTEIICEIASSSQSDNITYEIN